jgi:hypothetical protein
MKISKDGEYVVVPVPIRDLQSMARFIAHGVVANQNRVLDLSHEIVSGDLSKQDELVEKYIYALGIENWVLIYSGPEALELCDELAEKIYEEKPEVPGLLYKICVHCHKSYAGQCECPGFKRSQLKVVK